MKIAVIPNRSKPEAYAVCRAVPAQFSPGEAELIACDPELRAPYRQTDAESLYRTADAIVAVGGDGTIMHTAKRAAVYGKPVAGINAGRVGFLAGLEASELPLLRRLLTGSYTVDTRPVFTAEAGATRYDFINDLVAAKTGEESMIDLTAGYAGRGIAYRADGLIVATPTGSTAYSMSAGGPILDPALRCIVLTPICSHSLFSRSVIFDAARGITVRVAGAGQTAEVVLDGETRFLTDPSTEIRVALNPAIAVRFLVFHEDTFYHILSKKIK